ncbi:class C sortase [Macrococcus hajekii]|uniref:Class C sortase n=1 Tax=Macrococcus hajekii TaxID=198482 RepID=A0A4R6BJN2_9STAP|nr:class C sortase [Macrococcus hajekii]TDM01806.1 class C sortase [Macrococcus hajekii]GGB07623.1 class C sortase [Macrococcus hajekii]
MDTIESNKKKNRRSNITFLLVFLMGILILFYPFITAVYYDYQSSNDVNNFDKELETLSDREIDIRINKAKAYNTTLTNGEMLTDVFSEKQKEEGKALYAKMLEVHEKIGHIEIPSIHQDLPLFAGTSERILQQGLGHLERTSLPVGGKSTHTVITGHRGLPDKKLFTDLDKVEKGDMVYVHNIKEILAYKIDSIDVIEPNDFRKLKIRPGKDELTLLTCTPYMINSHRLIVTGHRVPYTPEVKKQHEATKDPWWFKFLNVYKNYLIGILIALVIYLLYRYCISRRKRIQNEKE